MFVQSAKFIENHGGNINKISVFGQDSNPTTWKMAQMNLAIRGIEADLGKFNADTFFNDCHPQLKADFIMANPPFNLSGWGADKLVDDVRWQYGTPPAGNANFAWLQHMIWHLAPNGRIGMVLANGSLSSQSGGEGEIRKNIINADLVDCIVAMPTQLFYTTQIPVSLWFLAKSKKQKGKTLFIDARKLGKLAKSSSLSRQNNSVNIAEGQRIRVNGGHVLTVTAHGVEVSGGDNPYDTESYVKAQRMADALASMLRNAGGTMTTVAHSKEEYARYTEGITDVMSYLGIDTSKDFTVNGMKYSKNKDGWYESEANSEAQAAYEQLKANNRTYQFADEKTKKQIAYISDYYLQTVPESVKAAWQETLEETGVNPFQTDLSSTLTQLSVEQDFLTGGNDNIFGETKESCLAAINKILERIENPLATMTEERTAYLQQEKEFYTVLASKIGE